MKRYFIVADNQVKIAELDIEIGRNEVATSVEAEI